MTKKDIDNIISVICPNDEDFEKACISPAYLKKELEALALEQEPCEDCISREAVLNALYALCDTGETLKENPRRDNPCIDAVVEAMEQLPSVRPKERTGEWQQGEIDWYKLGKCIEKGFRKGLKG